MATSKLRKEKTLEKLFQKPTGCQATQTENPNGQEEGSETLVTKSFMVELFTAIKEDIQELRSQLASDLKEVRRDVDGLGERVATLEEHDVHRDDDKHQLQQELLHLRDQNLDLQAHAEDLENRSRRNNIRIRNVPWKEEGGNLREYVLALFHHILGESDTPDIQMDRVHRVGLPRGDKAPPPDILVCVHDFQIKELILKKARDQQPLQFRSQHLALYQDLAASTLLKRREFKPITNHLREQKIAYSWGHPFRLIFHHNGKLVQLRSLEQATKLLGLDAPSPRSDRDPLTSAVKRRLSGWQRVGGEVLRPGPTEVQKEREAAIASVATVTIQPIDS